MHKARGCPGYNLENREFDMTPTFQRHGGLWNEEKQSQLIELLMLTMPI